MNSNQTTQEKAQQLIEKFYDAIERKGDFSKNYQKAVKNALICVCEIIKEFDEITSEDVTLKFIIKKMEYWEEVQRIILKLKK